MINIENYKEIGLSFLLFFLLSIFLLFFFFCFLSIWYQSPILFLVYIISLKVLLPFNFHKKIIDLRRPATSTVGSVEYLINKTRI